MAWSNVSHQKAVQNMPKGLDLNHFIGEYFVRSGKIRDNEMVDFKMTALRWDLILLGIVKETRLHANNLSINC